MQDLNQKSTQIARRSSSVRNSDYQAKRSYRSSDDEGRILSTSGEYISRNSVTSASVFKPFNYMSFSSLKFSGLRKVKGGNYSISRSSNGLYYIYDQVSEKLSSVDASTRIAKQAKSYGLLNISAVHHYGDIMVIIRANAKPAVIWRNSIEGHLNCRSLNEPLENGLLKLVKLEGLSLSFKHSLYVLDKNGGLLKYDWRDIQEGDTRTYEIIIEDVADFTVINDCLTVLCGNGELFVQGEGSSTILKTLKLSKWSFVTCAQERWVCAGINRPKEGTIATISADRSRVCSVLDLKLASGKPR